ncbi:HNH endonuclease family protein [Kineococcus rhizosphaerae]|uniref:HNH endonuclease family protein n=1 Tax=Kineococcus rhizosphaerae TaxID=559628 RepID=UPI001B8020B3|nr:HNH endonuclease family protein [Kineococcus rhizosphaerae]
MRAGRALALVVAGLLLGGCTTPAGDADGSAGAGTALAQLQTLPVKGRAPKTGYSRAQFGDGWVDTDHNGCDTRNDVLGRDLRDVRFKGGGDCVVASGSLTDPYGGGTIRFRRGQGTSDDVQIDHVVALSNAWQTGAQRWDAAERTEFANDRLELLAVDGPLNSSKGDGDAATWLPPNTAFRCTYVARQVAVKAEYGLWVTPAERDAIERVLATCPGQPAAD